MDHGEAELQMLSERYLLNELAPELREEFEEHFFSCQKCALDLGAGATFLDYSRAVLSSPAKLEPATAVQQTAKSWARFRPAFAAPALALLLIALAYQSLVSFPRLKHAALLAERPQVLPALSLINVSARGDNKATLLARQGQPFLLFVDIPSENRFPSYVASLYDAAGNQVWSLTIPQSVTKDTVSIQVPGRGTAGSYVLVVRAGDSGGQNQEVGRFPFELQFR